MRKLLLCAATALSLAALAPTANADTILTFGQKGSVNTIFGTAGPSGTTFSGVDIGVTVTQIAAGNATPFDAFLDITATNFDGASVGSNGLITQHYSGSFSFNSKADNTGTNYLSGTFSDGAVTKALATVIAVIADQTTFASDVITTLDLPRAFSLSLTNVNPSVSLSDCSGATCDTGKTISTFSSNVSGDASANPAPEPASLALLGAGLLGLGWAKRKRAA